MNLEGLVPEQELSTEVSSNDPSTYLDVDNAPGVRFGGKEYTIEDFKKGWMRQEDYTKKTQTLAEERKQYDQFIPHLYSDLEKIRTNPQLATQFREVYPKQFHAALDALLKTGVNQAQDGKRGGEDAFSERVARIESHLKEQEIKAIEQELAAMAKTYEQKYEMAKEADVMYRAQLLLDTKAKQGDNAPISSEQWDNLWKQSHDERMSDFKNYQSKQFNNQKQANLKSRDMASGGGIPGQAPKVAKNLREAQDLLMSSLE